MQRSKLETLFDKWEAERRQEYWGDAKGINSFLIKAQQEMQRAFKDIANDITKDIYTSDKTNSKEK